jgi:PAS domain S-box-containing protein
MRRETSRSAGAEAENSGSDARYRLLAENAWGAVFSATPDAVLDWVSPSVTRLLGWQPEQLVGRTPHDIVHPEDAELIRKAVAEVGTGAVADIRARFQTSELTYRWLAAMVRPLLDEEGNVVGRVGAWRDAEREVALEHDLVQSREEYRLLAENASDLVAMADNDGVLRWFSDSIRAYGWDPVEVVGHSALEFLHPDDRHLLRDVGESTARGDTARVVWRIAEKDDPDAWHWFRVHLRPVRNAAGVVVGRISGWQNIDHEKAVAARLAAEHARLRATVDSLMDPYVLLVPLRDAGGAVVDAEVRDANRLAAAYLRLPLTSLIGHTVGRVLSPERAERTLGWCRDAVLAGRPVVIDDVQLVVPDRGEPQWFDVRAVPMGDFVSLTWRNTTAAHARQQQLLELADRTRRRLDVFEPEMADVVADPEEVTDLLTECLERGCVGTALQPIVSLRDELRPVGYEALSRFPPSTLGGPAAWFTAAHRVGLGRELEVRAIAQALDVLADLPEDCLLSVNASPHALVAGLAGALGENVPWPRILLELTEHVPVDSYPTVNKTLAPLRAAGCRIAIDDAGSGFAGLRHLVELVPDVIKLDLALVRGIDGDPRRSALAGMLVSFAREIGAHVIAEGVETEAEHARVAELGVDWAQGYLFGRPELVTAPLA